MRNNQIPLTLIFCTLVALLDEWNQAFRVGRTSEWSDVVLDFKGASVGVLVWLGIYVFVKSLQALKGSKQ